MNSRENLSIRKVNIFDRSGPYTTLQKNLSPEEIISPEISPQLSHEISPQISHEISSHISHEISRHISHEISPLLTEIKKSLDYLTQLLTPKHYYHLFPHAKNINSNSFTIIDNNLCSFKYEFLNNSEICLVNPFGNKKIPFSYKSLTFTTQLFDLSHNYIGDISTKFLPNELSPDEYLLCFENINETDYILQGQFTLNEV